MKQVYGAKDPFEVHLIKNLLENEGIQVVVRGEHLFGLRGSIPVSQETWPSVWVVQDGDFERAQEVVLRRPRSGDARDKPLEEDENELSTD